MGGKIMTYASKSLIEDAKILKETIEISLDFGEPIERIAEQHRYLTHANNQVLRLVLETLNNAVARELIVCLETKNVDVISHYWIRLDFVNAVAKEHIEVWEE